MESPVERQWRLNTARRFARRKVKEFAAMEQQEYHVSLTIPYEREEDIVHTSSCPFCGDETCGCHLDRTLLQEYLITPVMDGLLTSEEAMRLFTGKQV